MRHWMKRISEDEKGDEDGKCTHLNRILTSIDQQYSYYSLVQRVYFPCERILFLGPPEAKAFASCQIYWKTRQRDIATQRCERAKKNCSSNPFSSLFLFYPQVSNVNFAIGYFHYYSRVLHSLSLSMSLPLYAIPSHLTVSGFEMVQISKTRSACSHSTSDQTNITSSVTHRYLRLPLRILSLESGPYNFPFFLPS